jgi:hypothetical protein
VPTLKQLGLAPRAEKLAAMPVEQKARIERLRRVPRWRTHFEACLHKARSHHCPCQEDRL